MASHGYFHPMVLSDLPTKEIECQKEPSTVLYQLDLVTPGSRQSCTISRNTWRETPKSLKPFGRPVKGNGYEAEPGHRCGVGSVIFYESSAFLQKINLFNSLLEGLTPVSILYNQSMALFSRSIMLLP
jgi:hypothetical protein